MNGLNKCVTIKEPGQLQNKDVRIIGCEDSYIYVDSNVSYLQISNCVNCTITIAAVNKTCSIDKCENVVICVASNFLKIGNIIDSTVHSYS
jgi:TBCC domain-containing protein 1